MSATALWLSHRGRIALVLSLFFVWATYYLWTGERESLITIPYKWEAPKNGITNNYNNESNHDYSDDEYHYALHTKTYAQTAAPKSTNIDRGKQEDYDIHFALHTKTFAPTVPSTKVQPTPVHIADGAPTATLIMDEFDKTPIRELCAETSWGPSRDVVINCEGRAGGVGMVRQEILVCIRHAIEIGASLIRPTIMSQSEGIAESQHGPVRSMSYMFDMEMFDARLRSACPLLPLYEDLRALERQGRTLARIGRPSDLPSENGQLMTPKAWAEQNLQGDGKITVIDYPLIMGQTPVCQDGPAFVANFGRLLEMRPDAQLLAAHALSEMSTRFRFSSATKPGTIENAFIGVHLCTEADATHEGYLSYEQQAAAYFDYINSTSLRVIYAASGNTTSLGLFAEAASALSPPAQVLTKWDLLGEEDIALLNSLTSDQQALVDYLILERSSKFAGVSESSFSWSIAYKRQLHSDVTPCTRDSKEEMTDDDGIVYQDNLSKLCGSQNDFFVDKMWP